MAAHKKLAYTIFHVVDLTGQLTPADLILRQKRFIVTDLFRFARLLFPAAQAR
jgi:hypothetical protein